MKRVILASGSPRRFELLSSFIEEFEVIPSSYEEDMTLEMSPSELVQFLSKGKARDIASKEKGIILGADTIVVLRDNKVLGKPKTEEEAKKMLRTISGDFHYVLTGFTIIDSENNKEITDFSSSKIFFRELSDEEIEEYVASGEPMDKAGAYAIQGLGGKFIPKYEGPYTGIIGLPLEKVKSYFLEFGIKVKK